MSDDAELLASALTGNENAFRSLYERYAGSILSFAWVMTHSKPDAEEIVQETFVVLIRKASSFDPRKSQLRTWLFGIARNLCYQKRQRDQRDHRLPDAESSRTIASSESELIREEAAEAVRSAVAALPEAQRAAVFLFEFEGLSLNETATVLQVEANAVKARLHRGRENLKNALAELNPSRKQS